MNHYEDTITGKLKIRAMARSDVSRIALLETEIFPDPWPESAFIEELGKDHRGVIVADIDGAITGYASYIITYGEAHLTNMAVTPKYRGKSIAKNLLNAILDIAKKADCEYVFLDVRPTNSVAISLYRKFGFYELYRRPNYYRNPAEDALVMVKNLDREDT
jgi:ribosomal-protein-alanine N-acetyltransferase